MPRVTVPIVSSGNILSRSGLSATNAPAVSLSESSSSVAPDVQTQMMFMLTESFSKLSTVLVDKQGDTKTEWPKFAGDSKVYGYFGSAISLMLLHGDRNLEVPAGFRKSSILQQNYQAFTPP